MSIKKKIEAIIKKVLGRELPVEVSIPTHGSFGHYSTNVAMRLAPSEKKAPLQIAKDLAEKISFIAPKGMFAKVEAVPPGFINFWLSEEFLRKELGAIYKKRAKYGESNLGRARKIIVEYSQPNIAKRMHVGHIRSTIIGDALANIYDALGYKVIRWNYLGDWGTQFGKLISAYKWWGDRGAVKKDPINTLQALYVRFHEEMKARPELESEGREEFRKLEMGDRENRALWKWFKEESLKEFEKIYVRLGIHFDTYIGESFFERDMAPLVAELKEMGLARKSEGAVIVPLEKFGLPPAVVEKSDGGSIYLARDIAGLRYRVKKYKPNRMLYVVGNEQALHFEQLFAIASLLGFKKGDFAHVKFGSILGEGGKKLSTREGRVVMLDEVVEKAVSLAGKIVEKKNSGLSEKKKKLIAEAVGIGALKYNDLKEHRTTDIVFDWEKMLDTHGMSGPYLQYTYARLSSIIKKAKRIGKTDLKHLSSPEELALIKKLLDFPEEIEKSAEQFTTNNIALYLYELANLANRFYESTPVLKDENALRRNARLVLIESVRSALKKGLGLLGIEAPEEI
ncbi:MAG: arginine--tRNA ligase [Candidatus Liptonbacteria bacterium]|nr:arginine--tRNA ligase [Candidatus Liptonbacteria bacterium]